MTGKRRAGLIGLLLASALVITVFGVLPGLLDRRFNAVLEQPLPAPGAASLSLHSRLQVVDLHADPLLWKRDLLRRNGHGHVDVPRLLDANVALQVFGAVTKSPRGQNYQRNSGSTDRITDLVIVQGWPPATWRSLLRRAQHQAAKLHEFAAGSDGRLRVIQDRAQLDAYLAERGQPRGMTAGLLAIEGLHAIEGELGNLDALFRAGFRMMGITHFFDNALGGSAHGIEQGGLTELGRRAVQRMQELGIVIDLAHASPAVVADVFAMVRQPVVFSHGGVQGSCPGPRNLSDEQLLALAGNGGVIGIGYWEAAICEASPAGFVAAVQHAARVAGIDHVALGSDFDGAVTTPFDSSQLALLTDALLQAGYSDPDIGKIMGQNALRVLREVLH